MAIESTRQQPSGFSTFVWALFFFFAFAILVILIVRSGGPVSGYEDQRAGYRLKIRDDRKKDDDEKLTTAGWVDQAKGVVRIPVADAKRAILADLQAKKPTASTVKVDPPMPMPVIDPNATEPPPPLMTSAPQGAYTMSFSAPVENTQPTSK